MAGALCACSVLAAARAPAPLSPAERRGRQIYLKGESPSGPPISATIGRDAEAPASLLPCSNCHGRDGTGKSEGGVTPPSIRWADLTRPYQVTLPNGRSHPQYDERLFARAVTQGIDPAGHTLSAAMPRFQMSERDAADLIAWLKRIGTDAESGITGDSIVIGSLLPLRNPGSNGFAIRAALAAYFETINASGGIYGRRIDFRTAALPAERSDRIQAARTFVTEHTPFALVASFSAGFEHQLSDLLRDADVPLVGPYTIFPGTEDPPNPQVFFLNAGLRGEAAALAGLAVRTFTDAHERIAMVVASDENYRAPADAARAVLTGHGWTVEEMTVDSRGNAGTTIAADLRKRETNIVLLLTPEDTVRDLFDTRPVAGWTPRFLMPGPLATEAVLGSVAARDGRLFLAYSFLPFDAEAVAAEEYQKLASSAGLPSNDVSLQLMALASARVLVEGLVRSGREVSHDKLIDALEGLYEFHPGFTPPLSFGPGRRIGSTGARVVTPDRKSGELRVVPDRP